jgi:ankyrin repeat protein
MVSAKEFAAAVWSGDLAVVDDLIERGADVNAADDQRDPPLFLAIEQQFAGIVQRLVSAGAQVNREVRGGWTPLTLAIDIESDTGWQAHYGEGHAKTELTEILLAAGAIPTEKALKVARDYNNTKALALMETYGSRNASDH